MNRAKPEAYFSDFSLCHWPTNDSPSRLLMADDGKVWLFDFDGTTVGTFDAPNSDEHATARGTLVSFEAGRPPLLAVLVELDNWDRAVLYVYDGNGVILYQEVLDQACAALAALPDDDSGSEVLLVGGRGTVWEYRAPKQTRSRLAGADCRFAVFLIGVETNGSPFVEPTSVFRSPIGSSVKALSHTQRGSPSSQMHW